MRFLAYLLLTPLFFVSYGLKFLGLRTLNILGVALGDFLYTVGFRKKIVSENLRLAFSRELSEEEIVRLERRVFRHIGTLFLEIARNFSLSREQMCSELLVAEEDMAKVRKILAPGRGAVFISSHMGNWELLAAGMAAHGFPVELVVKKMNNMVSQVLIERQRVRSGIGVIYSGGTLEKMKVSLAQGKAIGFMMDQNTTGKKGIRANFFGVPASSIRGLAKLVRETGVPVLPIGSIRQPSGKLRVMILDPLPYLEAPELPAGSEERILREEWLNTQLYQDTLEKMIRLKPEQWLWIHRRWKASRAPLDPKTAHLEQMEHGKG